MEVRAGTGPQELELQTACESPYGYWKLNWVLYKSNTCSLPLGHILSPTVSLLEFLSFLLYTSWVALLQCQTGRSMPAVLTAGTRSSTQSKCVDSTSAQKP